MMNLLMLVMVQHPFTVILRMTRQNQPHQLQQGGQQEEAMCQVSVLNNTSILNENDAHTQTYTCHTHTTHNFNSHFQANCG